MSIFFFTFTFININIYLNYKIMSKKSSLSQSEEIIIYGILERATADIEFRELILNNPDQVLEPFKNILSEASLNALKMYRRVALEELGIDLRRFREGGSTRDNGAKVTS